MEPKVGRWRGLLDSLATTGGHIAVLLWLIHLGVGVVILGETRGWMKVAEMGAGMFGYAFGALTMMYKPSGTNLEQVARAGAPFTPPTATLTTTSKVDAIVTTENQPDKKEQTQ